MKKELTRLFVRKVLKMLQEEGPNIDSRARELKRVNIAYQQDKEKAALIKLKNANDALKTSTPEEKGDNTQKKKDAENDVRLAKDRVKAAKIAGPTS